MGVETMMMVAAAVGAAGTIYNGMQQAEAADNQAQIAENNAAYEADANKQHAEKIRRMAKAQRGEANAALAASGVKLGEGTALEVQKDITKRSEEDALSEGRPGIVRNPRKNRLVDCSETENRLS